MENPHVKGIVFDTEMFGRPVVAKWQEGRGFSIDGAITYAELDELIRRCQEPLEAGSGSAAAPAEDLPPAGAGQGNELGAAAGSADLLLGGQPPDRVDEPGHQEG